MAQSKRRRLEASHGATIVHAASFRLLAVAIVVFLATTVLVAINVIIF